MRTTRLTMLSLLFAAFLLPRANGHAETPPPQEGADQEDLVPLPNAKAKVAYVRPGVDWNKYKTIFVLPLNIPPDARNAAPDQSRPSSARVGESYILKDSDVQVLKDRFAEVVRDELNKSKSLRVVEAPQADSLIVATQIVRLLLPAPLESTRIGYAGRGKTFTQGAGAATLASAFADGGDYSVVARVIDNRYSSSTWQQNTIVNNLAEFDRICAGWGRDIRRRLEDIQAGKRPMP